MIVCQDLTRKFGEFVSVNSVNLSVKQGELFGFLGLNGAGKTTTIKMMTGLLSPTSGSVSLGGFDVVRQPLDAKQIFGYVPDAPFLYDKLSGREYLDFMADLYRMPGSGREARIDSLLTLFDLSNKGNELIQGYSRGMRQKIALAGAIIHDPKIIFLDEPTVGLDPRSARTMEGILTELCRRGMTVLISTHVLDVAQRMCNRIAILHRGTIAAQGSMEELRAFGQTAGTPDHPRSLEEIFFSLTGEAGTTDIERLLL